MVRNYVRKTTRGSWSVVKMREAIDAVLSQTMGCKKAANLYGVPSSTLARRVREMRQYEPIISQVTSIKTEETASDEEQHEETVEAYISNPPLPKLKKIQTLTKQNEAQDHTSHSFPSHSVNEPLEQTRSFITHSVEVPSPSTSLNPTALYWSHKLESLEPTQRLFAEKYINEILLEAQLGNLSRNSVIINGCDQNVKSPYSADSDCIPTTSSNN
ncbi:hypothetical protein PYW08_009224 [Mythimna loreyi]|uniref:Uncharacterized protein n=1 Tax=Mythimna loreyi TaxID=667449 RepID=A0ACC2QBW6_9NEOP|nr:hypothetical protein PYW08_009224 [Mythimna loreyi]